MPDFLTALVAVVPVLLTALPAARIGRSIRMPLSSCALRFRVWIWLTLEMIVACVSSMDSLPSMMTCRSGPRADNCKNSWRMRSWKSIG